MKLQHKFKLILRKEAFGGILFDPEDGTYIEMDFEAFDFLKKWFKFEAESEEKKEIEFINRLNEEIKFLKYKREKCKVVENPLKETLLSTKNFVPLSSPTLVDIQVTTKCNMGCPHCYASSHPDGKDIPYEDLLIALDEFSACGVCQVALGGGEPLLHPRIVEILYEIANRGIVPNITTTADGLTPDILSAMVECCGAVALSLEGVGAEFDKRRKSGFHFFNRVKDLLIENGINLVFQITLSKQNLPFLPSIVKYCLECEGLYGVIFLSYKPAGRGKDYETPLSSAATRELFPALRDAFSGLYEKTKVGYDCCMTPGIIGMEVESGRINPQLFEGCSATRSSIALTSDLNIVPCSFLPDHFLGNVKKESLIDIWNGYKAMDFRYKLDKTIDERNECIKCSFRTHCLGGCPQWNLINCTGMEKFNFELKS